MTAADPLGRTAGAPPLTQAERTAARVAFRDSIASGSTAHLDEHPRPAPTRTRHLQNPDPKK